MVAALKGKLNLYMKIKNIEFENGLFLAPMAGVADRAFRHMCKKYGAEGVVTEMISSKALVFGDKKTEILAKIDSYGAAVRIAAFRKRSFYYGKSCGNSNEIFA